MTILIGIWRNRLFVPVKLSIRRLTHSRVISVHLILHKRVPRFLVINRVVWKYAPFTYSCLIFLPVLTSEISIEIVSYFELIF